MKNAQKLAALIVKRGGNPVESVELANKHIKYLERSYSDSSLSSWATVAVTLG